MDEGYMEVDFATYCKKCRHSSAKDTDEPCNECLEYPMRLYSTVPEKFEENRKCTKCGLVVKMPPNDGKGGKGQKCPICGKQMVFKNACQNCGAKIIPPK